jgi:MFS family permease
MQNYAMNVAVPIVARELGVAIADVSWVILGYTLVITATLIAAGRLGDLWGTRRAFLAGLSLYFVGSTLSGFAPSLPWLFAARIVQGLGASLSVANQLALSSQAASPSRRGRIISLIWVVAMAGQVTGPAIGGIVTDLWGWRYVFWLNGPLALIVIGWIWRLFPRDQASPRERSLDLPGVGLFAVAVGLLLLTINRGPSWGLGISLGLVLLISFLFIAFYKRERATKLPMLDLSLFRVTGFPALLGTGMANHAAVSGVLFLAPFYLIERQGLTAGQAGAVVIPMSVVLMVVSGSSGMVSDRWGTRGPMAIGMTCMAIALLGIALALPLLTPPLLVLGLLLFGFGTGLFVVPNQSAIMAVGAQGQLGLVGGISNTARYVGIAGGVALVGALYSVGRQWHPDDPHLGFQLAFGTLAFLLGLSATVTALQGRHSSPEIAGATPG